MNRTVQYCTYAWQTKKFRSPYRLARGHGARLATVFEERIDKVSYDMQERHEIDDQGCNDRQRRQVRCG